MQATLMPAVFKVDSSNNGSTFWSFLVIITT